MANTADYAAVNGNMVFGVRALSTSTISTLLNANPVLAILAAWNPQKKDPILGLGDPSNSMIFSGAKLDAVKVREIEECAWYSPEIQAIYQQDGKDVAYRDTAPTLSQGSGATLVPVLTSGVITSVTISAGGTGFSGSLPTLIVVDPLGSGAALEAVITAGAISGVTILSGGYNYSSGAAILVQTGASIGEKFARPVFKWHEMQDVGYIYHRDIRRARETARNDEKYFDQLSESLVSNAIKDCIGGQITKSSRRMWFGQPASETADVWSSCWGLLKAIDDGTNTPVYAGIDRTATANYWWQAKYDHTAYTWNLKDVVQDAMYNKGIAAKGANVDLLVCGPTLFMKFQNDALAYTQQMETGPDLKMLGQYGFQLPVLRYANTYIVYDPQCPPKTVLALNMKSFIIAFRKGAKWTPSEMYDQTKVEGGKMADLFYLTTQWMPMCIAPPLNAKYDNVS